MPRGRKAFTLIELLVVIGILVILVSIVAYGISRVVDNTRRASTKVVLENMKSMTTELEVTTKGLTRQPARIYYNNGTFTSPPNTIDIWRDANPVDGATLPEPDPALSPADVTKGPNEGLNFSHPVASGRANQRYNSDGVANTQLVMSLLLQAPANKSLFGSFPPSQLLEAVPTVIQGDTSRKIMLAGTTTTPQPALVLDAWGNPLLFVPAGGLCGEDAIGTMDAPNPFAMWVGGPPDPGHTKGSKQVVSGASPLTADQVGPIRSPDNRPFWASAGPDGDFCKADDNLYSFEN